jgi:hypothetical protein
LVSALEKAVNLVFAAALEMHIFCEDRGWRYCFIGGVAVHRWGEPRATDDVDLTLLTGFGGEEPFVDEFLRYFRGREANAREFALRRRVLFLTMTNEVNADVALGGIPFEERSVDRSSVWTVDDRHPLRTCSAEDWIDVTGILARQRGKLNLDLVRSELKPLLELKGEPEIVDRLESEITRLAQPFKMIEPTQGNVEG